MKLRTILPFLLFFIHALSAQGTGNVPRIYGPATIQYAQANGQIVLPAGTFFSQGDSAKIWLAHNGYPDTDVDAVIVSFADDSKWNIRLKFYLDGYITTGDAKSELGDIFLVEEIKKQWDKENGLRLQNGFADQPYTRIIENPTFSDEGPMFSYSFEAIQDTIFMIERRTIVFGRAGVLLASLSCLHSQYAGVKQAENSLLSSFSFQSGFRYADFNSDNDKGADNGVGMVLFGLERHRYGWVWKAILILFLAAIAGGYYYYERTYLQKKKPLPRRRASTGQIRPSSMPPLTPPPSSTKR